MILDRHLMRIAQISGGFPYYVHLIGEQMLWSVMDDPEETKVIGQTHFEEGICNAVSEAQASLRGIYEKATQKYNDPYVYEEILWAVADRHVLTRQITDIYTTSYCRIMSERADRKPLTKGQFYQRMNNLKTDAHGSILRVRHAGWYEFRETIVRGYVRLRAEEQGIVLGKEAFN